MNKKIKILIVIANYYQEISAGLYESASKIFSKIEFKNIDVIYVPGIFEIPVTIVKKINKYDAFLALGCVIKGQTPHFDFISKTTIDAIMQLSLERKKPIGNGIITCLNMKQAIARKQKGKEAAEAVLSVLSQL